jgi:hypothetical protein
MFERGYEYSKFFNAFDYAGIFSVRRPIDGVWTYEGKLLPFLYFKFKRRKFPGIYIKVWEFTFVIMWGKRKCP